MDERQLQNPNTTLNGYIMEFWKFDLTWKLKYPIQQKNQKEQKETTKRRRNILNHNGPKVNLQLNT